jgi:exportin-7
MRLRVAGLDPGNYILGYLAANVPTLPVFVTSSLIQLLCRVARLAWNDDPAHRDIVAEVAKFLQVYPRQPHV